MKGHRLPIGVLPVLLLALVLTGFAAAPAGAVTQDELLTRFGSYGSGPGQFNGVADIATDPSTGHVYLSDGGNRRIDEFTPWGQFVKSFGWDVVPGSVNEQQEIVVRAASGQFRLSFGASTTGDIEHDASAGEVEASLNGLASVQAGSGSVKVAIGPSDPVSTRYLVSFTGGALAAEDVAPIAGQDGTVPLGGGVPTSSVEVRTRAEGTASGTGLESCTAESGCKAGTLGSGAGQFKVGVQLAVDSGGNVYAMESLDGIEGRLTKFDSAGNFLWVAGGEVNKTRSAEPGSTVAERNLCTQADVEAGDECGAGVAGTGPGQFAGVTNDVTISSTDTLFVGDQNRIQEFEPDGTFKGEIAVPGETVRQLSIDPSDSYFYAIFDTKPNVRKLSLSGEAIGTLPVPRPTALAVGPSGEVFVRNAKMEHDPEELLEFASSGASRTVLTVPGNEESFSLGTNTSGDFYRFVRTSFEDHYVEVYGPPPVEFEPPPLAAPEISAQYAVSVTPEDATVAADINPEFWSDTRYYVEYGTGKCSEGGCTAQRPLPPGALLVERAVKKALRGSVLIDGLEPSTTYHYRFVAESSGGGPVRGVGGTIGADGTEASFRTPARSVRPTALGACARDEFRTGAAGLLPDCRAYEMVSPVDKANGDVRALVNGQGRESRLTQSATDGEAFTYTSVRAFASPVAAPFVSQYMARRGSAGWTSENLSPVQGGNSFAGTSAGPLADNRFRVFSPDLCNAWLLNDTPTLLAPGAVADFPNLYRRSNCTGGAAYQALTTVEPQHIDPALYAPELQGYSSDGTKAVIRTAENLTADAPAQPLACVEDETFCFGRAYEASAGELRLVCILPNGTPYPGSCSAGSPPLDGTFDLASRDRVASVRHAMSEDGSRIYWSATSQETGPGSIYLRLNGASTEQVSGTVTGAESYFLGASADGARALFVVEDLKAPITALNEDLYRYDLDSKSAVKIAGKVRGVAAASEDLSRIYFVSREAIPGSGENSEGASAVAGRPNLYLQSEAGKAFIATLSAPDVTVAWREGAIGRPSNVDPEAVFHAARASKDGEHLAFISTEPLTGYDTSDQSRGAPNSQIYLYEAGSGELVCVSCNPTGARPRGRFLRAPAGDEYLAAAELPLATFQLHTPRVLAEDGSRLFFTAYDALVPRDVNGRADVYEWERPGSGSCEQSAPAFSPSNGGCLYLISTGTGTSDSILLDASAAGRDVFFTTLSSLLAQDPEFVDVYDAREGGGFAPPPPALPPCGGEACLGAPLGPRDPAPVSATYSGTGNAVEKPARKKKHRHKARHRKHRQKKQDQQRRVHGKGRMGR